MVLKAPPDARCDLPEPRTQQQCRRHQCARADHHGICCDVAHAGADTLDEPVAVHYLLRVVPDDRHPTLGLEVRDFACRVPAPSVPPQACGTTARGEERPRHGTDLVVLRGAGHAAQVDGFLPRQDHAVDGTAAAEDVGLQVVAPRAVVHVAHFVDRRDPGLGEDVEEARDVVGDGRIAGFDQHDVPGGARGQLRDDGAPRGAATHHHDRSCVHRAAPWRCAASL